MEKPSTVDRAWSTVPPTGTPPQLLYLDTLRGSDFGQFYKRQSFDLLDVQAGQRVLDADRLWGLEWNAMRAQQAGVISEEECGR